MSIDVESLRQWCETILSGDEGNPTRGLDDYLATIPRLSTLADVPDGPPVRVRGDADAKPGEKVGQGDIRLRSMQETLQFGIDRGWKQIVFGHRGRDPQESLGKVADRLGEILGREVPLIDDWMNDETGEISADLETAIQNASPGAILMLENTRKYDLERVLWKKSPEQLASMEDELARLATFANEVARKVATVYVNEAFSAGSLDTSSVVIPIAMEKVALGKYVASELEGPVMKCLDAQMVVFSGIKTDKLDDLEAIMSRGNVKLVIGAGVLGMALKKGYVEAAGGTFSLGAAENPKYSDAPFYVSSDRIEQAKRIIADGHAHGVDFALPVDVMLESGEIVEDLDPDQAQFDVGPSSSEEYEKKVADFIEKQQPGDPDNSVVAFYNGVFGKFEEERFAGGTKRFVQQLAVLEDAGVNVYVGGGEGGKAVTKYLGEDKITHLFTAGGTVLNALGSEPVPYLVALRMAAAR